MKRSQYVKTPDLTLVSGVVSKRILNATWAASEALTNANVRHVLIGGLAVGAYGYVRATKDVDFVVGEEAFIVHGGGVVTFKPGVPVAAGDVPVDLLQADEVTSADLRKPAVTAGIPVIDFEGLIYLKLRAFRRRDQEDVIELFRTGHDEKLMRRFLRDNAPDLLSRFDQLSVHFDDEEG